MRRLLLSLSLGLGSCLGPALAATPVAALPGEHLRWYRLDARGVTAYTDGDPDAAEALVAELLRFRAGLELALRGGPEPDGRPLVVHLFDGPASFRPYKPVVGGEVSSAAGFFLPRREGAYLALQLFNPSGARIVKHELVHHRIHRMLGGAPPWLDEGLAEYLAASHFDDGALVVGEPIAEHVGRLRSDGPLPMASFVRTPVFEAAHAASGHARRLYAQSWAITHWLRTGGAEAAALLERQLAELRDRGETARDLVELSGLPAAELSARVMAHALAEPLPVERVPVPRTAAPALTRRALDRGETLCSLGELLLALGRPEEAREHFEAARRARPSFGRSWRGLGLVLESEARAAQARPLLEAAAERAPDDPEVLLSLGRNLLGITAPDFDADRVPEEDSARARQVLQRAVALAPDRAESLAALGLAGLMTTKTAEPETGAALEIARELLPHRSDVAYHLMLWHLRRGELEAATELLQTAVLPREEEGSELAVRALNVLTLATIERAQALRVEGRREEARALLDARLEAGVHESLRPQVLGLFGELR